MMDVDLVIVGGGVAGLSAGLYAAWQKLDAVLIERMGTGGQIVNAARVENFPGFPGGVGGYDLAAQMAEQAMDLGLRVEYAEVQGLGSEGDRHVVHTDGETYRARAVILTAGSTLARLGCPGEAELEGRGVSYCALCDAGFFAGQPVVVVGGGDSAADEALYLAGVASEVTVLVRGEEWQAAAALAERVEANEMIAVRWGTTVEAIEGAEGVEGVRVRTADGAPETIPCTGVFIYTGLAPNTAWLADLLPLDEGGHVEVDAWMRTAVPGIFAAGDIRQHSARQLVTVAGDGGTAAVAAARYLRSGEWR